MKKMEVEKSRWTVPLRNLITILESMLYVRTPVLARLGGGSFLHLFVPKMIVINALSIGGRDVYS